MRAKLTVFGKEAFIIRRNHILVEILPWSSEMRALFAELLRNEDGATAIEYGLIAALISIAAVTIMSTVGTNLSSVFNTVATDL